MTSVWPCAFLGAVSLVLPALPGAQAAGWSGAPGAGLARAEYDFRPLGAGAGVWSAPNRAQGLRSRVSGAGLELGARVPAAGEPWTLRLATTSLGRADGAQAGARLVFSVAPAGDVNSDGFSDVLVSDCARRDACAEERRRP